ncbi:MAG: lipid-A-disaccharide synthase [Gammaproteobacteria bacterium]|jgi:lipid-A-disaccharide synthase|nr:lipid-A-disaccharide synthase [Gammaproteobacteria bacterium]MDP7297595.1 lipid-A-disaccharide synthase [Gammaproteobacteria bacterium]MDP7419149.1 lipid-A-disaccharide synthase [Gammaproteobacteria bacterium]MDP7660455.1 lipid-A-disaccharide synthase [Gammaproteobacteria bacterium]HJP38429.1 lipid-A-disaccharide synthase [Gammaproteobacteria bacterium]
MPRIVVIAGEASGDRLGASFIRSALAQRPDLKIEGVAGPLMRAAGCDAWFDSQDLAVMGFVDVVRHLPRLLRIKRSVVRRLLADPPDVLLGIDAPDFNLRVEKVARRAGIRSVHYVCPSVWAWREGRVRVLRRVCDRVLCLLPFEPAFLARHGIDGEFVGHPLADEIPFEVNQHEARQRLGIGPGPVVTVMSGSRVSEVERLGPYFAQAAAWLNNEVDGIHFVVPAASAELRVMIESQFDAFAPSARVIIQDGDAHGAIAAGDAVLLASGTASLEAMLLKRPMVVAYRVSAINSFAAKLLRAIGVLKVIYFSLPNLLANRRLVPEFLQEQVTAEVLGKNILSVMQASPQRDELLATFDQLQTQLRCSAGDRAAHAVLKLAGLLGSGTGGG